MLSKVATPSTVFAVGLPEILALSGPVRMERVTGVDSGAGLPSASRTFTTMGEVAVRRGADELKLDAGGHGDGIVVLIVDAHDNRWTDRQPIGVTRGLLDEGNGVGPRTLSHGNRLGCGVSQRVGGGGQGVIAD